MRRVLPLSIEDEVDHPRHTLLAVVSTFLQSPEPALESSALLEIRLSSKPVSVVLVKEGATMTSKYSDVSTQDLERMLGELQLASDEIDRFGVAGGWSPLTTQAMIDALKQKRSEIFDVWNAREDR